MRSRAAPEDGEGSGHLPQVRERLLRTTTARSSIARAHGRGRRRGRAHGRGPPRAALGHQRPALLLVSREGAARASTTSVCAATSCWPTSRASPDPFPGVRRRRPPATRPQLGVGEAREDLRQDGHRAPGARARGGSVVEPMRGLVVGQEDAVAPARISRPGRVSNRSASSASAPPRAAPELQDAVEVVRGQGAEAAQKPSQEAAVGRVLHLHVARHVGDRDPSPGGPPRSRRPRWRSPSR